MKQWENSLFTHIKSQTESAEDRIQKRMHQNLEGLVSGDSLFKQRVEEELSKLKRKVDFLEQTKIKIPEMPTYTHEESIPTYKGEYPKAIFN